MRRDWKISLFLGLTVFMMTPVHTSLAMIVSDPGGVLMVDGPDGDSTVGGIAFNVTFPNDYDFGYVNGSTFNPIVSSTPGPFIGAGMGSWSFSGGDLVNFALKEHSDGGSIFSLADGFGTLNFLEEVAASSVIPSGITPYFNTLQISWNIPSLGFGTTILGAGAGSDGLAVSPVPIPPAALLFGTGLIGLIGIARRSLFVR